MFKAISAACLPRSPAIRPDRLTRFAGTIDTNPVSDLWVRRVAVAAARTHRGKGEGR